MLENAHPMNAADLLVHGTFALRRELDRVAHPIRSPGPPGRSARAALVFPRQTLPRDGKGASGRAVAEQLPEHARLARQVADRDRAYDLAGAHQR
jgi:hypothetical protein